MIELLVVIGIIVILIALLIPGITAAKIASKNVTCVNNLRELSYDFQGYLNDYKTAPIWSGAVPGLSSFVWIDLLRPYGNIDKTRFCPMANTYSGAHLRNDGQMIASGYGSTFEGWNASSSWGTGYDFSQTMPTATNIDIGSYGMNWYCYNKNGTLPGGTCFPVYPTTGPQGQTPLFADCMWVDSGCGPGDTLANQSETGMDVNYGPWGINGVGGSPCGTTGSVVRWCLARHGRGINMVYMDGHASRVQLVNLLQQYWYPNYALSTAPLLSIP
jgi:prepilin-type processing-associated H-X9-DG protein